ncbi:MAG: cyclodeaminase/cyclohydrolase family protein [Proteobacteria bacterium]|nr:cyclodeaminase/cyclohydrolase family protein [Pseudomonadota bacterium]
MLESGRYYLRRMHKSTGLPVGDVIETAVQAMGLRDVAPFETEKKVLGLPRPAGDLVRKTVGEFVDEVSRDTPAPGGGSIAALSGSIGAALAAMVANLTVGKAEFGGRYEELDALAARAQDTRTSCWPRSTRTRRPSTASWTPCACRRTRRTRRARAARRSSPATSMPPRSHWRPPGSAARHSNCACWPRAAAMTS